MNIFKIIKGLWTTKSEVNKIKEAKMKSGFFSSEFWLTVAGAVSTLGLMFWGSVNPATAVTVVAVLISVYTVCRTVIKLTPSKLDDEFFNNLIAKLKPFLDKIGVPTEPLN